MSILEDINKRKFEDARTKISEYGEVDKNKNNVLHLLAVNYNENLFDDIIKKYSSFLLEFNSMGETPIHIAAYNNNVKMLKKIKNLYDNDIEEYTFDIKNNSGNIPIYCSIKHGAKEAFVFLAQSGSDINSINNDGNTPLHVATMNNQILIVKYLINEGEAEIDSQNKINNSPLHIAYSKNYLDIAKFLEDSEADKTIVNDNQMLPYEMADDSIDYTS